MKNICDWENCKEIGSYKAPVERDNSKNFRYFCLEHIKIFNKNWNYFSNMSEEQNILLNLILPGISLQKVLLLQKIFQNIME